MNITIVVNGDKNTKEKLARLGSGLLQLDNGMRQIGEYLSAYYANEAFASQGQVFGSTWARLSQPYSVWKAKHFPGRPPLVRTGEMQRSFGYDAGSQSVKVGNNTEYFKFHQAGTGRIPQRKMTGFSMANKRMIAKILSQEIKAKLESA